MARQPRMLPRRVAGQVETVAALVAARAVALAGARAVALQARAVQIPVARLAAAATRGAQQRQAVRAVVVARLEVRHQCQHRCLFSQPWLLSAVFFASAGASPAWGRLAVFSISEPRLCRHERRCGCRQGSLSSGRPGRTGAGVVPSAHGGHLARSCRQAGETNRQRSPVPRTAAAAIRGRQHSALFHPAVCRFLVKFFTLFFTIKFPTPLTPIANFDL